jgi:hypothetical protein
MTLKASTEHVHWKDLAKIFTEVTGRKAVYKDISLEEYFASGIFPNPDGKVGHSADPNDTTLQDVSTKFHRLLGYVQGEWPQCRKFTKRL